MLRSLLDQKTWSPLSLILSFFIFLFLCSKDSPSSLLGAAPSKQDSNVASMDLLANVDWATLGYVGLGIGAAVLLGYGLYRYFVPARPPFPNDFYLDVVTSDTIGPSKFVPDAIAALGLREVVEKVAAAEVVEKVVAAEVVEKVVAAEVVEKVVAAEVVEKVVAKTAQEILDKSRELLSANPHDKALALDFLRACSDMGRVKSSGAFEGLRNITEHSVAVAIASPEGLTDSLQDAILGFMLTTSNLVSLGMPATRAHLEAAGNVILGYAGVQAALHPPATAAMTSAIECALDITAEMFHVVLEEEVRKKAISQLSLEALSSLQRLVGDGSTSSLACSEPGAEVLLGPLVAALLTLLLGGRKGLSAQGLARNLGGLWISLVTSFVALSLGVPLLPAMGLSLVHRLLFVWWLTRHSVTYGKLSSRVPQVPKLLPWRKTPPKTKS